MLKNDSINYFKLTPVFCLLISGFLAFISKSVSDYFTLFALLGCLYFSINHFKDIPKYLKIAFLIVIFYLIICSLNTYSIPASFSDGIRYLLPFIVMFYGLTFKNDFTFLVKTILLIVLLNNCYQVISYIVYAFNTDWYYLMGNSSNGVNGIIRACGITHSFDFFAFLNLIAFYLSYNFYKIRYVYVFAIFLLLSFSFKYIMIFILLLAYLGEFKKIGFIAVISLTILLSHSGLRAKIYDGVSEKYSRFFVEHNSPRPESYRVLKDHILSKSIVYAEGVGVFGGPASTRYHSEYYEKVSFDWHGREFATTDTYYPHLFIELGLIQGLMYLFSVFIVFVVDHKYLRKLSFIVITFLFSSVFSFSMNSFIFLVFSFILVFPLMYSEKQKISLS
ncbi:MAG: hypothetical protein WA775_09460 [Psychroserpens sp.]|uniref:hypothetical protein n=1 Tax=Psychroserpens sp. TaxID=2020870 RepID=UPI003C752D81